MSPSCARLPDWTSVTITPHFVFEVKVSSDLSVIFCTTTPKSFFTSGFLKPELFILQLPYGNFHLEPFSVLMIPTFSLFAISVAPTSLEGYLLPLWPFH